MHVQGLIKRWTAENLPGNHPESKYNKAMKRGLLCLSLIVTIPLYLACANGDQGFVVGGTHDAALQQQRSADFVVRLADPFDWKWFEIEKPWAWEFVDEADVESNTLNKRIIPHSQRTRNSQDQVMVQYEYDLLGLISAMSASTIEKRNIVVIVHPGFTTDNTNDVNNAMEFRRAITSLGFTNLWLQKGFSHGVYPLPFPEVDKPRDK